MKLLKKFFLICILTIFYVYVCNISMLPNNIILMQGDTLQLNTVFGLEVKSSETMQASSSLNNKIVAETGKLDLSLSLFNLFGVKDLTVNVIPKTTVIPVGKAIGMKMYTEGVLVVGMSEIEGEKPYEFSGIEAGDKIIEIDNKKVNSTDELIECVNNSNGKNIEIKYISEQEEKTTSIEPIMTSDNEYKLGLWVRDAAAGVGTLTFYEPSSGQFGALGHGINDVDTYELIDIASGELVTTNILEIVKGADGAPGEIRGSIDNGVTIGKISKNTSFGVYGNVENFAKVQNGNSNEMEVANRTEIQTGKAQILCELENGKTES